MPRINRRGFFGWIGAGAATATAVAAKPAVDTRLHHLRTRELASYYDVATETLHVDGCTYTREFIEDMPYGQFREYILSALEDAPRWHTCHYPKDFWETLRDQASRTA